MEVGIPLEVDWPPPGEILLNVRFAVPEAKEINAVKSPRRLMSVLMLEYQRTHHSGGSGERRTLSQYEVIHSI